MPKYYEKIMKIFKHWEFRHQDAKLLQVIL